MTIMSTLVVRYPDGSTADNQALVEAVFDPLEVEQPDGVHYACLRLDDGTFRHIATITAEPNPLLSLATFTAFSFTLADRCEPSNGPQATPAALIGKYRLLA